MRKLEKSFYLRSAMDCVTDFLGKVIVHQTPLGRISGIITDVEAYPAFSDQVHHGNKKTQRTEIMWHEGGKAYVYVIYGVWNQFAIVVNKENIPDVVFIRGVIPFEGKEIMKKQWDKEINENKLTNSPGKFCKSFLVSKQQYGINLTGKELFLEDWSVNIPKEAIEIASRVGISAKHEGFNKPLRYFIKSEEVKTELLGRFGCRNRR